MRDGTARSAAATLVVLLAACAGPDKTATRPSGAQSGKAGETAPAGATLVPCAPLGAAIVTPDASANAFALVVIVDRSGSMLGPKLDSTKQAISALREVLDPSDLLGVVAFDSQPEVVVRLQPVENADAIAQGIASVKADGGTQTLPALEAGYRDLAGANAKRRHALLISDGQSAYDCIERLVGWVGSQGITTSTVGIGDADSRLLGMIARAGGGTFHAVDDLATLPQVFADEAQRARAAPQHP